MFPLRDVDDTDIAPVVSFAGNGFSKWFVHVGSGSKRFRALFDKARKMSRCAILNEETDSLAGKRETYMAEGR